MFSVHLSNEPAGSISDKVSILLLFFSLGWSRNLPVRLLSSRRRAMLEYLVLSWKDPQHLIQHETTLAFLVIIGISPTLHIAHHICPIRILENLRI